MQTIRASGVFFPNGICMQYPFLQDSDTNAESTKEVRVKMVGDFKGTTFSRYVWTHGESDITYTNSISNKIQV